MFQRQRREKTRSSAKEEKKGEESLDLFSAARRSVPVGAAKSGRRAPDDLLSGAEKEKHDYDWLLTPPGSPTSSAASRSTLTARSDSATKSIRVIPQHLFTNGRSQSRIPARPTAERGGAPVHVSRSNSLSSRPATPTGRPKPASGARPSTSAKTRPPVSSRPATPTARPTVSSPGYRPATPTRRVPVTANDVPVRARLPEQRPVTAGRSRPRVPLAAAPPPPDNVPRRGSSPARSWPNHNQNQTQKAVVKPAPVADGGGFGRTLSKKSLDVALRHIDIRQGMAAVRGVALFPHSVRTTAPPEKVVTMAPPPQREAALLSRAIGRDIFESSRYNTILLKEDVRNMSWLHSNEDKPDMSWLEPLPEPFIML